MSESTGSPTTSAATSQKPKKEPGDQNFRLGPLSPATQAAIRTVARLAGKTQQAVIGDLVGKLEAAAVPDGKSIIAMELDKLFQRYEAERRKVVQEAFGPALEQGQGSSLGAAGAVSK